MDEKLLGKCADCNGEDSQMCERCGGTGIDARNLGFALWYVVGGLSEYSVNHNQANQSGLRFLRLMERLKGEMDG